MAEFAEYVGTELFKLYFKLSNEIESTTADKKTQLSFLEMCLEQSQKLIDNKQKADLLKE